MNLTRTTEYALTVLSFIAAGEESVYSAEYLYEHLRIPKMYLRRLLTRLSKAGLIVSTRGRGGGFVFGRDPGTISLKEIIDLMEGKEAGSRCILGFSLCVTGGQCALHQEWAGVINAMNEVLTRTTLGSLKRDRTIMPKGITA